MDANTCSPPRWSAESIARVCLLAACLALLPLAAGWVPIARFTRERIDIRVAPGAINVEGRYFYRNPLPFPIVQGLSIPVPGAPEFAGAAKVSATDESHAVALPVAMIAGTPRLQIRLAAFEEICVRVRYEQYASANRGRYILTTTRAWGRPLERGVYTLRADDAEITGSNYTLVAADPGFMFERHQFMPAMDWQFSWRPR